MGIIETAVVRSAAGFLPVIAKKVYTRTQVNRIARNASSILVADSPTRFLESLGTEQLRLIQDFVSSPQFGNVVLQAFIFSLKGNRDEDRAEVRAQLRSHIRHEDLLIEGDLFQATDMLEELVYSSVYAVLSAAPEKFARKDLVANSSSLAAAAARNSELLARIVNLNAINSFASKLRSQVKRRHGKLSLPSAVKSTSVPYEDLYVRPNLRKEGADRTLSVEDAISANMRTVILGDPGAGKSTLAGKLVHDLASGKVATLESQVPIMLG
ncbi:NACHT domain-containing protein [Actinacidiphila paucisporea]|uniref:Uncharacterized protein n=1 Tax=Actinacidiphila paucisporea TaxID=310782 RepID=A0A1M7CN19_9ACTN|nr:hypothetical protein [Actinacidiphila paucisporea]SHL68585.1 hypothetical protein SAMN05216499_105291 [Actinacidiphila paucisporea]